MKSTKSRSQRQRLALSNDHQVRLYISQSVSSMGPWNLNQGRQTQLLMQMVVPLAYPQPGPENPGSRPLNSDVIPWDGTKGGETRKRLGKACIAFVVPLAFSS